MKRDDQPVSRVTRNRHGSANLEPSQAHRVLRGDIDPVDPGASWPLAHETDEQLDGFPPALEDRLDAAVREVPHPTCDAVGERAPAGRLAEEDALDVTLDDDASALHASRLEPDHDGLRLAQRDFAIVARVTRSGRSPIVNRRRSADSRGGSAYQLFLANRPR